MKPRVIRERVLASVEGDEGLPCELASPLVADRSCTVDSRRVAIRGGLRGAFDLERQGRAGEMSRAGEPVKGGDGTIVRQEIERFLECHADVSFSYGVCGARAQEKYSGVEVEA